MGKIKVEDVQPQLVASMRYRGSYDEIMEVMPKLLGHLASNKVELTGPPIFICHEETPEGALEADRKGEADIEICAPIPREIEDSEGITCYTLPGGRVAKTIHEGPYSDFRPLHQQIYSWIREHHRKLVAPLREYYLNDPHRVHENEIMTEICAPIN